MIWSEIRAFSVLIADSTGVNSRRYRKKAFEAFDDKLYRKFRGVIEGIFGGLENRKDYYLQDIRKINENEAYI